MQKILQTLWKGGIQNCFIYAKQVYVLVKVMYNTYGSTYFAIPTRLCKFGITNEIMFIYKDDITSHFTSHLLSITFTGHCHLINNRNYQIYYVVDSIDTRNAIAQLRREKVVVTKEGLINLNDYFILKPLVCLNIYHKLPQNVNRIIANMIKSNSYSALDILHEQIAILFILDSYSYKKFKIINSEIHVLSNCEYFYKCVLTVDNKIKIFGDLLPVSQERDQYIVKPDIDCLIIKNQIYKIELYYTVLILKKYYSIKLPKGIMILIFNIMKEN